MKTLITLLALVCTSVTGKEKHDPLENQRLEYSFGIDIRMVDGVRYCTVNVEVSQRLLDALRKRDAGARIPCLVLRKKVPGMIGFPVNPTSFQLKRSAKPAWLKGHVAYEVTLPYDYLYGGRIDIQAMEFEMVPVKQVDRLNESLTI